MTDDRKNNESYNPPVDTRQSPGEASNDLTHEPGNNAAPSLETTLDTEPADSTPETDPGDL